MFLLCSIWRPYRWWLILISTSRGGVQSKTVIFILLEHKKWWPSKLQRMGCPTQATPPPVQKLPLVRGFSEPHQHPKVTALSLSLWPFAVRQPQRMSDTGLCRGDRTEQRTSTLPCGRGREKSSGWAFRLSHGITSCRGNFNLLLPRLQTCCPPGWSQEPVAQTMCVCLGNFCSFLHSFFPQIFTACLPWARHCGRTVERLPRTSWSRY